MTRASPLLSALSILLLATGRALAHGGHDGHADSPLPPVVFLTSVTLLGGSIYLDSTDRIKREHADAGVFASVAGLLVSVGLLLL